MSGPIAVGCIADDFTGATDVAAAFRRGGLRTVLRFVAPAAGARRPDADAIVVALKSRTIPAADAVAQALAVQRWLDDAGTERTYFKYCSTFDSTDAGNIGPVADSLLEATGERLTVVCPAAPEHGRTIYRGHLFVGDQLLSDSPMRHHPLTPMTDANLVHILGRQTPHRVGLVAREVVARGAAAVREELDRQAATGVRYAVVDAIEDGDLDTLALVAADLRLATGAAGLARALGRVVGDGIDRVERSAEAPPDERPLPRGRTLVLAGSSSAATLGQVRHATDRMPSLRLPVAAGADAESLAAPAVDWLDRQAGDEPVLVYASAPAEDRADADAGTAAAVEAAIARVARHAVEQGIRRIVVAGGETSGAVVAALGVDAVEVLAEEDVGVPWLVAADGELALLLKSGNFGGEDLFARAAVRVAA